MSDVSRVASFVSLLFLAAVHAHAAVLSPGTIVVTQPGHGVICGECDVRSELTWIDPNQLTLPVYYNVDSIFSHVLGTPVITDQSRLIVPAFNADETRLLTFDASGAKIGERLLPFVISGAAAGPDGTIVANSVFDTPTLSVLDEQGNIVRQFASTGITGSFDTDPAGCQILSTTADPTRLARFDVCTGQPLATWQIASPGAAQLRALADGGAVVATSSSPQQLWFLDATGATVRSVTVMIGNEEIADTMAFDSDPRYIWLGFGRFYSFSPFMLAQVSLDSGRVVTTVPFIQGGMAAFAVYGESRPSLSALTASSVPTLSWWFLMVLACSCAAIALRRMNG